MSNVTTVHHLLKMFEAMDVPGFLSFLTDDAVYRFGNYPAATGKEAIEATIKASHMSQITGIGFDIKSTHEQGDAVIVELAVNYNLVGGKVITLPCLDIFRFDGEKVKAMLVFMDSTPLFAS
jgi:ketosteroid isomerase-like protein